jgi:hypothetical protein
MKDANENILKALNSNFAEPVEFLEKCLNELTQDICLPNSECFANIGNTEVNTVSSINDIIQWTKASLFKADDLKYLVINKDSLENELFLWSC